MKKLILTVTVLTFITATAFSQDNALDHREEVQFGAKIGANYSNVYDTEGEEFDADAKTGLALGVFLSIPIGTYLGVQPEILFSQKGFKGSGAILGSEYKFTRTTNHIDVPLYLAFKPSEFITFVAGPQYSYMLSRTDKFESDFGSTEEKEEFENDEIRKNTLSASIGIDINIDNIVLGARAAWDLQDNKGDGSSSTPRYRNTWLQATIGFKL